MIKRFRLFIDRLFAPITPLPAGIYPYQSPPDAPTPYRLHLRLAPDGEGLLIINASTVLHLNQTAAEYAYHLIQGTPKQQVSEIISKRYSVSVAQAMQDFHELSERIDSLIHTPDLDPEVFLGFERLDPYSTNLSAPYRLDCALTYRCSEGASPLIVPVARVTRELETAEWQAILKKAWDAGIPQIVFTGGEPTLRPDLEDLLAYAESLGQVTGLLTDGLRLAETELLHNLLQSGLDHIMFLLDPSNETSWEALRDALAEDIFVTVHLTMTTANADTLDGLLPRLAEIGVKSLSLSASAPELETRLKQLVSTVANSGITLTWDLPVPYSAFNPVSLELAEGEPTPEGAGRAWMYVEPDGDVLPAQGVERVLGNLLTQDWDDIWQESTRDK